MDERIKYKFNEVNLIKNALIIYRDEQNKEMIMEKLKEALLQIEGMINKEKNKRQNHSSRREFTLEELYYYDGKEGRNSYVAINGTVYNVTSEKLWINGMHHGLNAGKDLSEEFKKCHKNKKILDTLQIVGTIKE